MVLVDDFRLVHSTKVETIRIRIVISNSEVDGLQRVECHTHTLVRQGYFLDGSLGSQVVQNETTIATTSQEDVMLTGIILNLEYGINIPLEFINRF